MKFITSLIFIVFSTITIFGQTIAPSINKDWSAQTYVELFNYLNELSDSEYPKLHEKDKLFEKVVSSINQPILKNKEIDLGVRMQEGITLQTGVNEILKKYYYAHNSGKDYSLEISYLLGISLSVSQQMVHVVNEFIEKLDPNDPTYNVRINGLQQMRRGTASQMDGALISLSETKTYNEEERLIMAKYIAENSVTILSFLEEEYQKEFIAKLEQHLSIETNHEIIQTLEALSISLKK